MMAYKKFYRAFTLVEVMGAVAVVSTLAVLAVVTAKDMVLSGQRSAVQRELQMLNGALQQFRAAGGVIPDDASAAAAVRKLREGVGIEGDNYAPLTTDPKMSMEIGGEPYELSYDPDPGFSYVNADGEGMGLAGGELPPTPGAGAEAYPFDITDPLAVASALEELDMLDPDSPEYQDYLNALGAAMSLGGLGEDAENLLRDSMDSRGYVYDPDTGTWSLADGGSDWGPPLDYHQPVVNPEIYRDTIREMLDNGVSWGELDEFYRSLLTGLFFTEAVALGGTEALEQGARLNAEYGLSFPPLESGSLSANNYPRFSILEENPVAVAGYGVILYEGAEEQWVPVTKGDVTWSGVETEAPITFQADPGTYMVFYRSVAEMEAGDAEWKIGVALTSEDGQFSGTLSSGDDLSGAWNSGLLFMIVPYTP